MAKEFIEREAIKYEQWAVGPLNAPLMVVRKKTIESLPAADVVEVVHGRWEDLIPQEEKRWKWDCVLRCSNCMALYGDNRFNYCPNCGADMRVGKEEKLEIHSKKDGE